MTTIAQQLEQLEQDMRDATTPANGDPLVLPVLGASVRIWADRLSAIRAAVGGEAENSNARDDDILTPPEQLASRLIDAWCAEKGRQMPWATAVEITAIVTKMPDAEMSRLIALADEPSPPATVDVGASAELLDLAANFETCIGFLPPTGQRNIDKNIKRLRELAALIGEKA